MSPFFPLYLIYIAEAPPAASARSSPCTRSRSVSATLLAGATLHFTVSVRPKPRCCRTYSPAEIRCPQIRHALNFLLRIVSLFTLTRTVFVLATRLLLLLLLLLLLALPCGASGGTPRGQTCRGCNSAWGSRSYPHLRQCRERHV